MAVDMGRINSRGIAVKLQGMERYRARGGEYGGSTKISRGARLRNYDNSNC
jgi:hypothetical protein